MFLNFLSRYKKPRKPQPALTWPTSGFLTTSKPLHRPSPRVPSPHRGRPHHTPSTRGSPSASPSSQLFAFSFEYSSKCKRSAARMGSAPRSSKRRPRREVGGKRYTRNIHHRRSAIPADNRRYLCKCTARRFHTGSRTATSRRFFCRPCSSGSRRSTRNLPGCILWGHCPLRVGPRKGPGKLAPRCSVSFLLIPPI